MRLLAAHTSVAILVLGAGGIAGAQNAPVKCVPPAAEAFRSISEAEMQSLTADVGKSNPTLLAELREDPERRRSQVESLRELLALASQAVRDGVASRTTECIELRSIADEVTAVAYDRERNKGRPPKGGFGYITQASVAAFWGEGGPNRIPAAEIEARETKFNEFFDAKVALLRADNPQMKDRIVTDEERALARDLFARTEIYVDEFRKSSILTQVFRNNVSMQIKLQQAQFLSRQYSDSIADKVRASDAEIEVYITSRPELDPARKRAKAEEVLKRALAGEDFASLANEFSDDPGNLGEDGKKFGGLYSGVKAGQFVAPFEKAALSLDPGKVHGQLTPTDFGYHVIKLEKKSFGGLTYDVRHILISTGYKDPDDPNAKEMPLNEYVRSRIEDEKMKTLIDRLVVENGISVPDDFEVPVAAKAAPVRTAKPKARVPVRKRN